MCWLPVCVAQFFTSSLTMKSLALSAAITWPLVGAATFTVGSGAAGSGLAVPSTRAGAGADGCAGPASDGDVSMGVALADARGGAGGGGGGRLSLPPPHAAKRVGRVDRAMRVI